jgi:hypothetical protein
VKWAPQIGDMVRVRELGISGKVDPRISWAGAIIRIVDPLHVVLRDTLTGAHIERHVGRLEPVGSALQRSQRADDGPHNNNN